MLPQRLEDLSWVQTEPIAALAQQWVELNPGKSIRKLAIQVSKTVAQMGYLRNPGSIQSVLGGHKKTTRGFVYRGVLLQFGTTKRNLAIPAEHFVGARAHLPVCDATTSKETQEARTQPRDRSPTLQEYLEEANDYLPRARSAHHQIRVYIRGLSSAAQHPIHRVDRPIRTLALAILIQALHDRIGRRSHSSEGARETIYWHQDAREWLFSASPGRQLSLDLRQPGNASGEDVLQSSQASQKETVKRLLRLRIVH